MTFLFFGTFNNRCMEKCHICRSLFNNDLLSTNYSSCVDVKVGHNNILSAYPPFTAGLKQGWHFNQLHLLLWPGFTQSLHPQWYTVLGVEPSKPICACSATVKYHNSQI